MVLGRVKRKTAQMSSFMVIGIVLIIMISMVIAFASAAKKTSLSKEAKGILNKAFDKASIDNYVESCLAQVSKDALLNISYSGGFFRNVRNPKDDSNLNSNIDFAVFHDAETDMEYDVAYLISKDVDDFGPMYPCPLFGSDCGGNGPRNIPSEQTNLFCRFAFSDFLNIDTCEYGYNPKINLELTGASIEKQLESKISEMMLTCVDLKYLSDEAGIEIEKISEDDVKIDVSFSSNSIEFIADFPIVIRFSDSDASRVSRSKFSFKSDFKKVFENLFFGSLSLLREENRNIENNLLEYAEARLLLNNLDYNIYKHSNINFLDDVYELRSKNVKINNKPFKFLFAVGNRVPVLDLIDPSIDDPACEITAGVGSIISIRPEAKDPDDGDILEFSYTNHDSDWYFEDYIAKRKIVVSDKPDGFSINVIVTDTEYNDSQEVKICIDDSLSSSELDIDFFYEYEGFDKTYFMGGEPIKRMSLEDPIKIYLVGGVADEGKFSVGNCVSPTLTTDCIVFPGWTSCNSDFNIGINEISSKFESCGLGSNSKIRFQKTSSNTANAELLIKVDKCVPHRDFSLNAGNNDYIKSHMCCAQNGNEFAYAGSSYSIAPEENNYCGNPVEYPDINHIYSNDVWKLTSQLSCGSDRGNIFSYGSSEIWTRDESRENPDDIERGQDKRCIGCGEFGEVIDSFLYKVNYDYESYGGMYTFEDYSLETGKYVCDSTEACTIGAGLGKYDSQNTPGPNMVTLCKGACNSGFCNYAVDCVCEYDCYDSDELNLDLLACDGRIPGEAINKCTLTDYFVDKCSSICSVEIDETSFNCEAEGCSCDLECHTKKPGQVVDSCGAENEVYLDACSDTGRVIDFVDIITSSPRCGFNDYESCGEILDECQGENINSPFSSYGDLRCEFGDKKLIDMCGEECGYVDSNVCCKNSPIVADECEGKKLGEGIDTGSSANLDAFCNSCDRPERCYPYALNPSTGSCYTESDSELNWKIKCDSFRNKISNLGNIICES